MKGCINLEGDATSATEVTGLRSALTSCSPSRFRGSSDAGVCDAISWSNGSDVCDAIAWVFTFLGGVMLLNSLVAVGVDVLIAI